MLLLRRGATSAVAEPVCAGAQTPTGASGTTLSRASRGNWHMNVKMVCQWLSPNLDLNILSSEMLSYLMIQDQRINVFRRALGLVAFWAWKL